MWRRVERRFSITAPNMKVRPHHPWYLRWAMLVPFLLAAIGLAWWAYDSGLELAGFHRGEAEQELSRLRDQVTTLSQKNGALTDQIAQYERQIQIEQASNLEAANQLKVLMDENDRLQEDLGFFQDLTTASTSKDGELGVHRLKLQRDMMPGEYNLRMLLVRGGQRAKQFIGSYQLVASIVENGQRTTKVFTHDATGNTPFELNFRYYQRVEQRIQLPPESQLEDVQVRIFEKGAVEPKVRQSVSP